MRSTLAEIEKKLAMRSHIVALLAFGGFPVLNSMSEAVNKNFLSPIPIIEFVDTPLLDAIEYIRVRSIELDTRELDDRRKGINLVVDRDHLNQGELGKRITLRREYVKFEEILIEVCDQTGTAYIVLDSSVLVTSKLRAAELAPQRILVEHAKQSPPSEQRLTRRRGQPSGAGESILFFAAFPTPPRLPGL